MVRTRGAYLLARAGQPQHAIAARLGCTQQAVQQWLAGTVKPGKLRRSELAQQFGIPVEAWDEEMKRTPRAIVEQAPVAAPAPVAPVVVEPEDGAAMLAAIARDAFRQTQAIQRDPIATPGEVSQVLQRCSATIRNTIQDRRDEGSTWRQILDSPEWAQILAAVRAALEPHPTAAAQLADDLAALGAKWGGK